MLIRYEDAQGDQDAQHTQGVQDDQHTQDDQWVGELFQGKQGKHLKYIGLAHLESFTKRTPPPSMEFGGKKIRPRPWPLY